MPTSDELWEWIYQPLQDLKADVADDPEKSWEQRWSFFLEKLGLRGSSDHPLTEALFTKLDELSEDDRATLIAGDRLDALVYELCQTFAEDTPAGETSADGTQVGQAAATSVADEAAWQSFLVEYGAQWDGTAESWDQFRAWLLYYANERGVGEPTEQLLVYLDGQSAQDRVATLVQYGVPIAAPAQPAPAQAADAPPSVDDVVANYLPDVLAENPEFANISEERRRELIAEVLAETAGSAQ